MPLPMSQSTWKMWVLYDYDYEWFRDYFKYHLNPGLVCTVLQDKTFSPLRCGSSTPTDASTSWWRSWRWWTASRRPTASSLCRPKRCSTPACSAPRVCQRPVSPVVNGTFLAKLSEAKLHCQLWLTLLTWLSSHLSTGSHSPYWPLLCVSLAGSVFSLAGSLGLSLYFIFYSPLLFQIFRFGLNIVNSMMLLQCIQKVFRLKFCYFTALF